MKDDRVYLLHVRDAVQRILEYTSEGREAFFQDAKTQDAVVRNLEIVGEAVKHLSDAGKSACPEVPWKRVAGMRDKLIHEYFGVNLALVWDVVALDLPNLKACIDRVLGE